MDAAPGAICLLRLSALGDVAHMVPVAQTIRTCWPDTALSWIIGKQEARLVEGIPGIEFLEYDKRDAWGSYRRMAAQLGGRRFDVLLCPQVSMRANLVSLLVRADMKLGYDRMRARNLHSLFVRQRIPFAPRQHVLDSFFSFLEYLGLHERDMRWNYAIPDEALEFADRHVDPDRFTILISPCSSHPLRNWSPERYAAVADQAVDSFDAQVILCGGPADAELRMGEAIERRMKKPVLNLIGKDTLKKFLALLKGADALVCPDSGPAHLAAAFKTPVVGLYAASNPERSGPYFSRQWCVDRYAAAAEAFKRKPANQLKWGTKLEYEGVMDLVGVRDVAAKLDLLYRNR